MAYDYRYERHRRILLHPRGAGYQAQQDRPAVQSFGSFKCQVRRNEVYSWHGDYDYIDWTAIETISLRRKKVDIAAK
jgi:hypothetical protein